MIRLNSLQYNPLSLPNVESNLSPNPFDTTLFDAQSQKLCKQFGYSKLKTFAFSKEGFLGLLLELQGNIGIGLGETQALYEAGKLYEKLGFSIHWIPLTEEGFLDVETLTSLKLDYFFVSSYVSDTYVTIDLNTVKEKTQAKILSNATAQQSQESDALYFDNYKLSGFNSSGVLLFDDHSFALLPVGTIDTLGVSLLLQGLEQQHFNLTLKEQFQVSLEEQFQEKLFYFVKPTNTLAYTLHIGLKGIKARELIYAMAFREIYLSNGEGCSLGLSKPSRILQHMGYTQDECREALHLSFSKSLNTQQIQNTISALYLEYMQLKA